MTALRPPPEHENVRWHWIETPSGLKPWMWAEGVWIQPGTSNLLLSERAVGCRYSHPCLPNAIPFSPTDHATVECVARALARDHLGMGDSDAVMASIIDSRWPEFSSDARTAITALSERSKP